MRISVTGVALFVGLLGPIPRLAFGSASEGARAPALPTVQVNRSLPRLDAPVRQLRFSDPPTEAELFGARLFEEPLLPMPGAVDRGEDRALARALCEYERRSRSDDFSSLTAFLGRFPRSRWRGALLLDLGIAYYWSGYFSRALASWEEAWELTKNVSAPAARSVADRALGEAAAMNARLGRVHRLEVLLREASGRDVRGPATERLRGAAEGLHVMRYRTSEAFLCGPYAVAKVLACQHPSLGVPGPVRAARSTPHGTTLASIAALAREVGLEYRPAKRLRGAAVIVPSVVHWSADHFAAVVREEGGRYLMQDPTFGDEIWISANAIDDEGSGYFLVPDGALPAGWYPVSPREAELVWGKGHLPVWMPRP